MLKTIAEGAHIAANCNFPDDEWNLVVASDAMKQAPMTADCGPITLLNLMSCLTSHPLYPPSATRDTVRLRKWMSSILAEIPLGDVGDLDIIVDRSNYSNRSLNYEIFREKNSERHKGSIDPHAKLKLSEDLGKVASPSLFGTHPLGRRREKSFARAKIGRFFASLDAKRRPLFCRRRERKTQFREK